MMETLSVPKINVLRLNFAREGEKRTLYDEDDVTQIVFESIYIYRYVSVHIYVYLLPSVVTLGNDPHFQSHDVA